jgi:DNA-directed RNA polymerase omega subunit
MLYGRRLDDALEHVDGSRYALVHAVAKRARQITLWLTADPAELRAESAPPPAPGELISRDPVALAEAEILQGEIGVHWDPEGLEEPEAEQIVEADPLLIEGITEDEEDVEAVVDLESSMTPALAQALDGEGSDEADEADGEVEPEAADAEKVDEPEAVVDEEIVESLDAVNDDGDESED